MSNRLQLNPSKTEMLWCSSARRQHQIPTGPVRVGDTSVQPVRTVRDLGVYIDADVTMSAHATTHYTDTDPTRPDPTRPDPTSDKVCGLVVDRRGYDGLRRRPASLTKSGRARSGMWTHTVVVLLTFILIFTYYNYYSITPSLFHSRLKTFLSCKSFPP